MKLARPDIFHPRILLAGAADHSQDADAGDGLVDALRSRGLHARWVAWHDPITLDADLVILRATGDLSDRRDEFRGWTRQVRHLLNPPALLRWNSDPQYRADLARRGVPIADQPTDSTTALVYIGGEPAHAIGTNDPDWELWDAGHRALSASAEQVDVSVSEVLAARVEVTGDHLDPRVLGLDLVQPSLGLRDLDPDARRRRQRQFVLAVETALDRFGLGPLSHRRP